MSSRLRVQYASSNFVHRRPGVWFLILILTLTQCALGFARESNIVSKVAVDSKGADTNLCNIIFHYQAAEMGDLRVELGGRNNGNSVVFSRGTNQYVFVPRSGYACEKPAIEDGGHNVYLLVSSFRPEIVSGRIVKIVRAFENVTKCTVRGDVSFCVTNEVILSNSQLQQLMGGKRCWVSSIYGVSPDGKRLLLDIFSERQIENGLSYVENPYWFNLETGRIQEIDYGLHRDPK